MWFVKALFTILVLAVILAELMLNSKVTVDIFLTNSRTADISQVPLSLALLGAFVIGVLFWFVVSFFQVVTAKSEIGALKKRNRQLTRELTDLRNMPVKDLDPESLPPGLDEEEIHDR